MQDCPVCEAQDSLARDNQEGCIVCTECGTIARMGLEEDENTAWHDGTTGIDLDNEHGGHGDSTTVGGGAGGAANKRQPRSRLEGYQKRCMKVIYDLMDLAQVPGSVATTALHYMTEYSSSIAARNLANSAPNVLGGACFSLACAKWKLPIQSHELIKMLNDAEGESLSAQGKDGGGGAGSSDVRPGVLNDMKQRLIGDLVLQEEVKALNENLYIDLAGLYLSRLHIQKSPYPELVSVLAKSHLEVMKDAAQSASIRVCVGLYLAFCSKAVSSMLSRVLTAEAHEAATTSGSSSGEASAPPAAVVVVEAKVKEEAMSFLKRIAVVAHESEFAIKALLKNIAKTPGAAEALAGKFEEARKEARDAEAAKHQAANVNNIMAMPEALRGKRPRDTEQNDE